MSDSVAPCSAFSPSRNIFYGRFPTSAHHGARSSIIGEFTSHIQIMDDISGRFLSGGRLCHVSERKGSFDQ